MSHDAAYKLLFSHVRMVVDLLRGFVHEPWIEELDFNTLDRVSGSYVSDDLRDRHSDIVWRVQWGPRLLYIYILLEFQSTIDPYMALRIQIYTGLLHQDLIRRKQLPDNGNLPPILPLVLYNGRRPWNAATSLSDIIEPCPNSLARYQPNIHYLLLDEAQLEDEELSKLERNLVAAIFRLENSTSFPAMIRLVKAAAQLVDSPDSDSLQRAIIEWIRNRLLPARIENFSLPEIEAKTLSELVTMLNEREIDWTREWRQAGKQEGLREGLQQGLEYQCNILCKQAQARFDNETADSLGLLLKDVADSDLLTNIAIDFATSDDKQVFLNRVKTRLGELE